MKFLIDALRPIFDRLQVAPFGPLIELLLFVLIVVATARGIFLLLGRPKASDIQKAWSAFLALFPARRGYAPHWEAQRRRLEPYLSLIGSLYFAFGGLYSTALVTLAMLVGAKDVAWHLYVLGCGVGLSGLYYMRLNLEDASWAHARIRELRRSGSA